jgi:hypothetical protein
MQKSLRWWRLVFLLTLTSCFNSLTTNAQIGFTFSTSSGSYNAIAGTVINTAAADDVISTNLFLGFTFYYAGGAYTDFRVSSNGFISLGNNTTNSMPTNNLSTTGNGPIVAPLWDDLLVPANGMSYQVTGTAGSRILTVQWANVRWSRTASNSIINFQVKFYEGTNVIEFIYDPTTRTPNNASASIGLSGGGAISDFYSVLIDASLVATATYGSETNWNYRKPDDGDTYTWTPNNMFYVSSTTGQVTGNVSKCNNLQQAIISVQILTRGTVTPIALTQMKFDIVTTNVANLTGLHVYYSGNATGFAPANELGGVTITPATGTITVNGSQRLVTGTNYFWITYDVSPTAVSTQTLDARCTEITVSGTAYAPTITNPSGWRTIVDCSAAPGGITGSSFWVKANAGTSTTTNNGKVATWNDQSGNARHATNATSANQPTYLNNSTNNMNYNPVVDFDAAAQSTAAADYMDINTSGILSTGNNPYEVYAVIVPGVGNLSAPGKFLFAGEAGMNKFNSFDVRSSYAVNDSWNMSDLIINNIWTTDKASMLTFDYNYNRRETFNAGTSIGVLNGSGRTTANLNNALAYQRTGNLEFYDGGIAEIITYANASHGTTTREKVQSYLAVKYGVTLSHNYRNSDGAVVWNVATNAAYNNNIIGIARDDNGAQLQKQSKSTSVQQDILAIYIGASETVDQATNTGSFTAGDKSYFMVGSNNAPPVGGFPANPEKPTGICCRIPREWLVQKTNFTNTDVKLKFDFNSITPGYNPLNAGDLRLLVDADGNFTNATILNTPTITINAAAGIATITVPASTFNSTPYFTLASVSANTILAIQLKSFAGICKDQAIQLRWTSLTPTAYDFTVERSQDKVNFSPVGTVKDNVTDIFSWTDQAPLPGTLYYRLKTTQDNGSTLYSTILTVNSCNTTAIQLYTNPSTNESTLMLQLQKNDQPEISLYDLAGRRVEVQGLTGKRTMDKGVHYLPVTIPGKVAGMYMLHVTLNGEQHVFKVLKR